MADDSIEAELSKIFDDEAEFQQQFAADQARLDPAYLGLLQAAIEHDVTIPPVLAQGLTVLDADRVRYQDLSEAMQTTERPTAEAEMLDAFERLILARGFGEATGKNFASTLEVRDQALAGIFASDNYTDEQKTAFLRMANAFLAPFVDEVELPVPMRREWAGQVMHDFAKPVHKKMDAEKADHSIAMEIRADMERSLTEVLGERDDMKTLTYLLMTATRMLLVETSFPAGEPAEIDEEINRIMVSGGIDAYLENCGMDRRGAVELIKLAASELRNRGYSG